DYHLISIREADISIKYDQANIICQYEIFLENGNILSLNDTLKLTRINDIWIFNDLGKLSNIAREILNNNVIESITDYTLVSPFVNDRTYIPEPHYINPEIFEINAYITLNNVNRQLFGWGSEIDFAL